MPQSSYPGPVMLDNSQLRRTWRTLIVRCPTQCRPTERSPIAHHPAVRRPTMLRPAIISAALPMPLGEMPAIALMHPMVRHPSLVGMRVLPVTANPFVPTAIPAPVPAQPDVSGGGRGPVFLYARWRGSNCDNRAYVIPVRGCGSDHASAEYYRQHGNCYQLGCAKTGIRHMHSRRIEGGRFGWPQWRS
jgi:hypothetical protein